MKRLLITQKLRMEFDWSLIILSLLSLLTYKLICNIKLMVAHTQPGCMVIIRCKVDVIFNLNNVQQ